MPAPPSAIPHEQRAPRARVKLPLELRVAQSTEVIHSEALDFSTSGMLIPLAPPLPAVGERLHVKVVLPGGTQFLEGAAEIVRHASEPSAIGVRLLNVPPEAAALIAQLVSDTQLFGNFQLEALIGQGGMAEIYRAKALKGPHEGEIVALKRMRPELARDSKLVDLFLSEADLTRSLVHPRIVEVFETGAVGDTYYIAMEYVSGTLSHLLWACSQRDIKMPISLACYIAGCVAEGLEFAHNAFGADGQPLHIVHRDATPGNIFISLDGQVKIGDFGVARIGGFSNEEEGVVAGKTPYLAPEQFLGQPAAPATDVFALGAVLFETLTGRLAFPGDDREAVRKTIFAHKIPPPSTLRPQVSKRLDNVVMRALCPRLEGSPDTFGSKMGKLIGKKQMTRIPDAAAFSRELDTVYARGLGNATGLSTFIKNLMDPT